MCVVVQLQLLTGSIIISRIAMILTEPEQKQNSKANQNHIPHSETAFTSKKRRKGDVEEKKDFIVCHSLSTWRPSVLVKPLKWRRDADAGSNDKLQWHTQLTLLLLWCGESWLQFGVTLIAGNVQFIIFTSEICITLTIFLAPDVI